MRPLYYLFWGGAYGFLRAISQICRYLSRLGRSSYWHFPPDDFPSDETDAKVRNRPPHPGGTDSAQARPEVEGRDFSLVP